MRYRTPVLLALLAATLILYGQCAWHDFIILDDQLYVTNNPAIQGGLNWEGIRWAFSAASTQTSGNWHPVTWLSHMLDIQLFRMSPVGHHLTNVLFHTADVGLLFVLLCAMTGALWPSALVAALFALHPLHVESVAWVAERKDVLSTFFWMLTLLFYLGYVRRGGAARYLATLAAFVAGLMAKPMLVSLPLVMLMLDYWPLRRTAVAGAGGEAAANGERTTLQRLVLEKVPFFVVTGAFCALAIYAQHQGGYVPDLSVFPMSMRLYNALLAYQGYLFKALWPQSLAVYYPFPVVHSMLPALGAMLLLAAVSVFAAVNCRRRPYLLVGWLWFLVTLVPVIGLIQVGHQSMADRYMYIPLIGLAIMAAWGIPELVPASLRRPAVLAAAASVVLVAFSALTWRQLGYWRDSKSLLGHTLQVTSGNYYAHSLLANHLFQQGRYLEALPHYQAAVRINPRYEVAHYKIGLIAMMTGDIEAAVQHLSLALALNPASENAANARVSLNRCLEVQREAALQ